jgi:hypothetical protein
MREVSNADIILVVKYLGKKPLGRPIGRWENNIKMYLKGKCFSICLELNRISSSNTRAFISHLVK